MSGRTLNRVLQAIVISLAVPGFAFGATMSASEYSATKERASADYKAARAQCDRLAGNAKDVCIAQAKAVEIKTRAEAEAEYKNTDNARRDARISAAEADYAVAKAQCASKAGNDKDVCVKEAKAAETKVIVDAKATQKIAAARLDANEDKVDADYKLALEKCDAHSGAAKDNCVNAAKTKYHK